MSCPFIKLIKKRMLQTKSEGEFLIQELDINLESEQIEVVIVSDSEMNTKRKEK